MAAAAAVKPNCKYWDRCYQSNPAHLNSYTHPQDVNDDEEAWKKSFDLKGKKIVFTGALSRETRKEASIRAQKYGCIVMNAVSKNVDLVIVADNAGQKADKAEELGIKTIPEEDWEELLERQALLSKTTNKTTVKRKNLSSDEDDEDYEPETKRKKSPATKKAAKITHNMSESEEEEEMDISPPKKIPTKRKHSVSDSESDDVGVSPPKKNKAPSQADPGPSTDGATGVSSKSRPKCKYGNKCYRKDPAHLKKFSHPSSSSPRKGKSSSDEEDSGAGGGRRGGGEGDAGGEVKPKNHMADGETVDIQSGASTHRIKRTGDHYYCTCMAWKNQSKPVDSRTCKHLRGHLGEEFEKVRCGEDASVKPSRKPRQKSIPQVLLAHKYTESTDPTGWWMSEKLDGVRAYWDGTGFFSRLGNEFVAPAWFTKNYPSDMELDGELFGGRGKFQSTVSIVKTPGSDRWKQLTFQVFDAPGLGNKTFEQRVKMLKDHFKENKADTVVVLDHVKCRGKEHIQEELERVESLGGEGLMIRQPGSKYANGRSHTLLKIKTFHDAEAVVIGHEKGKGRNANVCGALRCRMESGKEFSVGSGLTDANRRSPPKKGSIITYRFQELTNDGVPRFPSYVGVRADMTKPKDAVLPAKPTDG